MLKIKTTLKEVAGKGIGLFAAQNISKYSVIWQHEHLFTRTYSAWEVAQMTAEQLKFLHKNGTPEGEDEWILEVDNARFINHSDNPNISYAIKPKKAIALRDIKAGEEITSDYRTLGISINFNIL